MASLGLPSHSLTYTPYPKLQPASMLTDTLHCAAAVLPGETVECENVEEEQVDDEQKRGLDGAQVSRGDARQRRRYERLGVLATEEPPQQRAEQEARAEGALDVVMQHCRYDNHARDRYNTLQAQFAYKAIPIESRLVNK
jgi:hypothetical protein